MSFMAIMGFIIIVIVNGEGPLCRLRLISAPFAWQARSVDLLSLIGEERRYYNILKNQQDYPLFQNLLYILDVL